MSAIIAIDIGGTQLRVAVYPQDGTVPIKVQRAPSLGMEAGVFERLTVLMIGLRSGRMSRSTSSAQPYPDRLTRIPASSSKLPTSPPGQIIPWPNCLSGNTMSRPLSVTTANLAVLGEWLYGAGKGHHDIVYTHHQHRHRRRSGVRR